jgi:hypothetical protein
MQFTAKEQRAQKEVLRHRQLPRRTGGPGRQQRERTLALLGGRAPLACQQGADASRQARERNDVGICDAIGS